MSGGIEVADQPDASRYVVTVDGELAGVAEYRLAGGRIDLFHTEVEERLRGRGVGSRLVAGALDDARDRGLSVVPTCPFVGAYIDRHPAYADLVDEE